MIFTVGCHCGKQIHSISLTSSWNVVSRLQIYSNAFLHPLCNCAWCSYNLTYSYEEILSNISSYDTMSGLHIVQWYALNINYHKRLNSELYKCHYFVDLSGIIVFVYGTGSFLCVQQIKNVFREY